MVSKAILPAALAAAVATKAIERARAAEGRAMTPGPRGEQGLKGDKGDTGDSGMVRVQAVDPQLSSAGLWIQTGLGAGGTDTTFWVEDGT